MQSIRAAGQFIVEKVLLPILQATVSGLMGFANAVLQTVSALVLGFTVSSTAEGISLAYGTVSKTFAMRVSNSLEIKVLVDGQVVYQVTNFFLLPQVFFAYETLSLFGEIPGMFLATYGLLDLSTALYYRIIGSSNGNEFSNEIWGSTRSLYLQVFLMYTVFYVLMFFSLQNELKKDFALSMLILHSSAVFGFSFIDWMKDLPKFLPSLANNDVFLRKMFSFLFSITGGVIIPYIKGEKMKEIFQYGISVLGFYTIGLMGMLMAKISGEATGGIGLLKSIGQIKGWFEFLETMRMFHTLMQLVWLILTMVNL